MMYDKDLQDDSLLADMILESFVKNNQWGNDENLVGNTLHKKRSFNDQKLSYNLKLINSTEKHTFFMCSSDIFLP
jgi:hypothetical protein